MNRYLFALAFVLLLAPVSAYPTIVVSAPGSEYIATPPVNSNSYSRDYQSTTYDYVDGYNAGYVSATRDNYLYSRRTYRDEVRYITPIARTDRTGYYFTNNQYSTYNMPGLDCEFGRGDICFNRYTHCSTGYCRVGDSDYRQYTYYNPYNVPGLYTLPDRSGIYYVS